MDSPLSLDKSRRDSFVPGSVTSIAQVFDGPLFRIEAVLLGDGSRHIMMGLSIRLTTSRANVRFEWRNPYQRFKVDLFLWDEFAIPILPALVAAPEKIGRASCRERV